MTVRLEQIISQALRDPACFSMLRGALSSNLAVANPLYRQVVEFASKFYDSYRKLPLEGDYGFWVDTLEDPLKTGVLSALHDILTSERENWTVEYISTEVASILKQVAARSVVARLGTMVPNVPPEAISTLAEELKKIEPISIHGLKALSNVEENIYAGQDEFSITSYSGIESLDHLIGGFRTGELVFTMADTGIGKTTLLTNIGRASALKGSRVLHITFELSAINTLKRYYRGIAEVDAVEVRAEPEKVVGKVKHWLRFAKGSVHVLYQPAYAVGADELKALVDQFVQIYGKVDLIILDYLDLMKPPAGSFRSTYESLGRLSHLVRNTGAEYEATTLSATQASRAAHNQRHLRLDTIGDSYQKAQAADIILGLAQTVEEFDAFQARLALLKLRENPGRGIEIPVYTNMDLMLIADLDSMNTRRLIKKLGHRPDHVLLAVG